jgi:hypothetical protein
MTIFNRDRSNEYKDTYLKKNESAMFTLKIFITSICVVAMWQSLFTIIDKYIGERIHINVIMLFVSSFSIYYLTGSIKLY